MKDGVVSPVMAPSKGKFYSGWVGFTVPKAAAEAAMTKSLNSYAFGEVQFLDQLGSRHRYCFAVQFDPDQIVTTDFIEVGGAAYHCNS